MALLTPTEKLHILEAKCLPKTEAERVASVLRNKFRFSVNRPNGNLIVTYLEKVVVDGGKVDRGQEYIRRIAKILDNANTELVAKEIERALATKGVYEFKVPANLMSKARELANMIVDNGFSFKEFAQWLEGAKAYKNDAEDIMRVGDVDDLEALYTQLLGVANEASTDDMTPVDKPSDDVEMFKLFEKLVDHLKEEHKEGVDFHVMADGSLTISPDLIAEDTIVQDMLDMLKEGGVNEAKMTIKRPYKRNGIELSPAITVQEEAATRNKIIRYLGDQPLFRASKMSIREFYNTINEDTDGNGNRVSSWLYRNTHLVKKIKVGKESFYKLTRAGLNLFNKLAKQVNEEVEDVVDQDAKIEELKEAHIPIYKNKENGELCYVAQVGNGSYSLFDLQDNELANGETKTAAMEGYELEEMEHTNEAEGGFSVKDLIDVEGVKKAIADCPEGETVIIIPHYSINVQSKYEDGEELQGDLDDLEDELGTSLIVNDYDDLVADPHGVLNEAAGEDELPEVLKPYYDAVEKDKGFKITGTTDHSFSFETAEPVPHHFEDNETEIQKFEVGADGNEVYCLFENNGDEIVLSSVEQLAEYVSLDGFDGTSITMEAIKSVFEGTALQSILNLKDCAGALVESKDGKSYNIRFKDGKYLIDSLITEGSAELEAAKDWFNSLSPEEKESMLASYSEETGKEVNAENPPAGFWRYLEMQNSMFADMDESKSYDVIVGGENQYAKNLIKESIMASGVGSINNLTQGDFVVTINDDVDRGVLDRSLRLHMDEGVEVQAFVNDIPVQLRSHKEMITEAAEHKDCFTVEKPTKAQMGYYRGLQSYLKKHFHAGKDYNFTSMGTLRIKKAIQERLTPYLNHLDVVMIDEAAAGTELKSISMGDGAKEKLESEGYTVDGKGEVLDADGKALGSLNMQNVLRFYPVIKGEGGEDIPNPLSSVDEAFGDVKKGGMHKALGIPEDDKISDHYESGKALADKLLDANGGDFGKTSKQLNFAANQGSDPDPIFREASDELKKRREREEGE